MVDRSIVAIVRRYLARVRAAGIPAVAGVLYGSFARGAQRPESDIDLLVLSPVFDSQKDHTLVDALWKLTWRVDSRIEPVPVGVRQFETDDVSPLICIAREEGVVIRPARRRKVAARAVAESAARYRARRKK